MNQNLQNIRKISNRLAIALVSLIILIFIGAFLAYTTDIITAPMAAFSAGIIGGFVGLQRRLKNMSPDDLELLANSWVYVCLSPVVGGILAVVLYILFISTLVSETCSRILKSLNPNQVHQRLKDLPQYSMCRVERWITQK